MSNSIRHEMDRQLGAAVDHCNPKQSKAEACVVFECVSQCFWRPSLFACRGQTTGQQCNPSTGSLAIDSHIVLSILSAKHNTER